MTTNSVPVLSCGRCNQVIIESVENPSLIVEAYDRDGILVSNIDRTYQSVFLLKSNTSYVVTPFGRSACKATPDANIRQIVHSCLGEPNETKAAKPSLGEK